MNRRLVVAAALAFLAACASEDDSAAVESALAAIDQTALLENTRTLSSDAYGGRAPGTPGEERTVDFLISQFEQLGLEPGNPDGGWTQDVHLVELRAQREASFTVDSNRTRLVPLDDFVAMSRRVTPEVRVEGSPIVFVGYGVVAPEYGWDDYKDVDVTGKTIVMLVNDPGFAAGDSALFRGRTMTYYGRWTYKYEIATEKGAAAAIIIHETEPAGYPWDVVRSSWGSANFDILPPDGNMGRVAVEAWIQNDVARRLFSAAGLDLDSLKRAAERPDFRPVTLDAQADFRLRNETREIASKNVVALLRGGDPERADEYVLYTAHWDHLGIGEPNAAGDSIYSGALDNASGTSGMIELARAFTALPEPPDRSIVFLSVTAEERGLLGAKYYAENPLYPLERTLANINIDGLNQWGPTNDIVVIGRGNTTLEDLIAEEAARQGRDVMPDPEPEKGFFYRSDHFEFARVGVPAIFTDAGTDYVGRPEGWGLQKRAEYTDVDYHQPSDEIKDDWDLSGAVQDLQLLFLLGHRVANGDEWPEWKEGSEFRARRLEMLGRAGS